MHNNMQSLKFSVTHYLKLILVLPIYKYLEKLSADVEKHYCRILNDPVVHTDRQMTEKLYNKIL